MAVWNLEEETFLPKQAVALYFYFQAIHLSQLVVIDNASHMVMMEAPDEVNKVMYEFIFQEICQYQDHDVKSLVSSTYSKRFSKSLP